MVVLRGVTVSYGRGTLELHRVGAALVRFKEAFSERYLLPGKLRLVHNLIAQARNLKPARSRHLRG